jgi:predicted RNA-binding Zn ribbon-like protein
MEIGLETAHAFLNSRDERRFGPYAGKAKRDLIDGPGGLKRWLVERRLLGPSERVTAEDVEAAVELRDRLRGLLARDADAAAAITALAGRYPLFVSFGPTPTLSTDARGVDAFLASVLAACATAALDGRWDRLKMCAAADCRFVFYDHGRNRLGRWCAMESCGNRMKARRYRERQARSRR